MARDMFGRWTTSMTLGRFFHRSSNYNGQKNENERRRFWGSDVRELLPKKSSKKYCL